MCRLLIFIFHLLVHCFVQSAKVTWKPDGSFAAPLNFLDNKLPCGRKNVHFEKTYVSAVKLSATNEMQSLILPVNGELQLSDGAILEFGPNSTDKDCHEGDSYYVERSQAAWLGADVWTSDSFTSATPDNRRIPCYDDDVVFPEQSQFNLILPDVEQRVRSISFKGRQVDDLSFQTIVESSGNSPQAFILNDDYSVGIKIGAKTCQSRAGCPCQEEQVTIDCSNKLCDSIKCKDPVRPSGHCCFVCGGILEFDIDINRFNFMSFKKQVDKIVENNGGNGSITHYLGLSSKNRIQVIMIDNEADGGAALAIHTLTKNLGGDDAPGFKQSLISGTPTSKVGANAEIAGLSFITVVVSFSIIYLIYQRPNLIARIPVPYNPFMNSQTFSRFREGSVSSIATSASRAFRSSFRNPLFPAPEGSSSDRTSQDVQTQACPDKGGRYSDQSSQQRVAMSELADLE